MAKRPSSYEQHLEQLRQSVTDLCATIDTLNVEIDGLKADKEALLNNYDFLYTQQIKLIEQNADWKYQVDTVKGDRDIMREVNRVNIETMREIAVECAEANNKVELLKESSKRQMLMIDGYAKREDEKSKRIDDLEGYLHDVEQKLLHARAGIGDIQTLRHAEAARYNKARIGIAEAWAKLEPLVRGIKETTRHSTVS